MTIVLPIPDREISPNGRRGHSKKAALIKARKVRRHVARARTLALKAIGELYHARGLPVPAFAGYRLAHFFPTAGYRDDDNADAACKAYRDGIAQALGIDDRSLPKLHISTRAKDATNPRVEFILIPASRPIGPEWDNELT